MRSTKATLINPKKHTSGHFLQLLLLEANAAIPHDQKGTTLEMRPE